MKHTTAVETQLIRIVVKTRAGDVRAVDGQSGMSLMEVIRDNGFDELMALCGGCCSCATCHVHIDPAFVDSLPPMSELEKDLLDSSDRRNACSRLACQVPITSDLDGLRVAIAPED